MSPYVASAVLVTSKFLSCCSPHKLVNISNEIYHSSIHAAYTVLLSHTSPISFMRYTIHYKKLSSTAIFWYKANKQTKKHSKDIKRECMIIMPSCSPIYFQILKKSFTTEKNNSGNQTTITMFVVTKKCKEF